MLLCHRVQENAYRVLRLPVSCTWSEINSAVSDMRRAILIGRCGMTEEDLPNLGEAVRSEASVRAAAGALSIPSQRIEHRLFWFHRRPSHEDPDRSQESAGYAAVKAHDDALLGLIAAYDERPGETGLMVAALRQWHQSVAKPQYWDVLSRIDCDGGFEPAVHAGEISALQDKAMELAGEPFARAAREAWLTKDLATVHDYLAAFATLEATGRWAADYRQNLILPVTTQLTDACETLISKYRTQIVHQDSAAAANQHVCAGELQYYRGFVEAAWKELEAVLTQNEADVRLGRGRTADCLAGVALDHTWADHLILAQDLAMEANKLAAGTIEEPRIEQKLRSLVDAGEKRRRGEWANAAAAFRSALEAFRNSYPERALPEEPAINGNQEICTQALSFYRDSIEPALNLLVKLSEDTQPLIDCRAHAARCLLVIATEYAWANEFTVAEEIVHEAISLAEGTEAAGDIRDGLARLQKSAERRSSSRESVDAAVAALRHRFATIARTFAGKIVAKEGYGQDNQLACSEELAYFRTQIEPALHELLTRLQPNDEMALDLREQAAACLSNIATDHTWANEFLVADRLMEESLTLAQGTWAALSIQKRYLWMRKSARTEQPKKHWSPVSLPSLMTIICLLVTATAFFSMLTKSKTASTSDAGPVQAGTTESGPSSASPASHPQPPTDQQAVGPVDARVAPTRDVAKRPDELIQLEDEIEIMKKERAAGAAVDSNVLNTKLYQYERLRKRRSEVQLPNQEDTSPNQQQ